MFLNCFEKIVFSLEPETICPDYKGQLRNRPVKNASVILGCIIISDTDTYYKDIWNEIKFKANGLDVL